jgi:hypothetical protein
MGDTCGKLDPTQEWNVKKVIIKGNAKLVCAPPISMMSNILRILGRCRGMGWSGGNIVNFGNDTCTKDCPLPSSLSLSGVVNGFY